MPGKPPIPLVVAPVTLCILLVVVVLLAGCGESDEPATAPAPPLAGGNELTPPIDPCGEAVPASAVDVNERQTVIGDVINIREVTDAQGELTLLEMGEQGGDVPFAIAISERNAAAFVSSFDEYLNKEICVNGVVQEYMDTPVIFVAEPGELIAPDE